MRDSYPVFRYAGHRDRHDPTGRATSARTRTGLTRTSPKEP